MSRFHKGVVLIAGLALIFPSAVWWKTRRDRQAARRELQAATMANEFLRKTMGDMTVEIAAKDREIDRLRRSACGGWEGVRPSLRWDQIAAEPAVICGDGAAPGVKPLLEILE